MSNWSWIITAGGMGKRMGNDLPKQFIRLQSKPILMHTLECIARLDPEGEFILTLPQDFHSHWKNLCKEHHFLLKHKLIAGGKERYHSVKLALTHCNKPVVAVHDGVRPFLARKTYDALHEATFIYKAVIPLVAVTDSLRRLNDEGTESTALIRAHYKNVQTPQVFDRHLLQRAYEQDYGYHVTDDACLVEQLGEHIHWVEGNESNIKITTPLDLVVAEYLLQKTTLSSGLN